jgi:hypothetical protein
LGQFPRTNSTRIQTIELDRIRCSNSNWKTLTFPPRNSFLILRSPRATRVPAGPTLSLPYLTSFFPTRETSSRWLQFLSLPPRPLPILTRGHGAAAGTRAGAASAAAFARASMEARPLSLAVQPCASSIAPPLLPAVALLISPPPEAP